MSVDSVCFTDRQQHNCPGQNTQTVTVFAVLEFARVLIDRLTFDVLSRSIDVNLPTLRCCVIRSFVRSFAAGATCNADGARSFPASQGKAGDNRHVY